MKKHKVRWHTLKYHVSCSCGWSHVGKDKAKAESEVAKHLAAPDTPVVK